MPQMPMQTDQLARAMPAPSGFVEPHAGLLIAPPDGQMLYKIMTVENFLRSVAGGYLHFNRVDGYPDFPGVDKHDGEQLPKDRPGNSASTFANAPSFSGADYYDQSRSRTYACCFSLENSDFIWRNYGNGSERGKVGIVFDYSGLRTSLNDTLRPENSAVMYQGVRCRPIFSINYGIVEYVKWRAHCENADHLPAPIRYTYLKDKEQFGDEKEMRVSLSALGVGNYVLNDGTAMKFPPSLRVDFDFRAAIGAGTIRQILCGPDSDRDFLYAELRKLKIEPAEGSDLP